MLLKYAITIFSTIQIESTRGESNILQNDAVKRYAYAIKRYAYAYAILYCNLFIALQFIKKHSIIEILYKYLNNKFIEAKITTSS